MKRIWILPALLIVLGAMISGCSNTVSLQEYTDIQLELIRAEAEISDLKNDIVKLNSDFESEIKDLQSDLDEVSSKRDMWEFEARHMKDEWDVLWKEYQDILTCYSPESVTTLEEYFESVFSCRENIGN